MRSLRSCLLNSLRQGDNAYVHCVSGISLAPKAAAVMGALLMGISFKEAKSIINQTRNVKDEKSEKHMEGAWIDTVLQESVTNAEVPTGFSYQELNTDTVLVHATVLVRERTEPICRCVLEATNKHGLKDDIFTVSSIEQASSQFKGTFCVDCKGLLRASLRLQIAPFYG